MTFEILSFIRGGLVQNAWKKTVMSVSLAALLSPGCAYLSPVPLDVIPNEVYQSKQLSCESLEHVIREQNIKTIINLRGENSGKTWYDEEVALAKKYGLAYFVFDYSASELPEPTMLFDTLVTMRDAQRPILIHCRAGVDRTGLISGLTLLLEGKSVHDAKKELNFWYTGHIAISETGILDTVIDEYRRARKKKNIDILTWVKEDYPQIYDHWKEKQGTAARNTER